MYLYLQKASTIISNNRQPSLSLTKNHSVIIHPAPIDYNGIWLDKSPCNSLKIWELWGSLLRGAEPSKHQVGMCSLLNIAEMQKQVLRAFDSIGSVSKLFFETEIHLPAAGQHKDRVPPRHRHQPSGSAVPSKTPEHKKNFEDSFNSFWPARLKHTRNCSGVWMSACDPGCKMYGSGLQGLQ